MKMRASQPSKRSGCSLPSSGGLLAASGRPEPSSALQMRSDQHSRLRFPGHGSSSSSSRRQTIFGSSWILSPL